MAETVTRPSRAPSGEITENFPCTEPSQIEHIGASEWPKPQWLSRQAV